MSVYAAVTPWWVGAVLLVSGLVAGVTVGIIVMALAAAAGRGGPR